MFKSGLRRRAFTLPEVLVTVAIVAVLAAVVVPAVTSQLDKADGPSLESTIGSLRTGVTAFVTDVRKYPRQLSDLNNAIGANDSSIFVNTTYGATGAAAWRGPYTSFSVAVNDSLPLGMSLKAFDSLVVDNNLVRMNLTGVNTHADVSAIDTLIDGATGNAAGNLQWTNTSGVVSLLRFYLTPAR